MSATPRRPKRSPRYSKLAENDLRSSQQTCAPTEYSPIFDLAPDSPLRVQGNLTGIPRKLKDLSADWHNARLKWKQESQSGYLVCNQIGNIKMDSFIESVSLPETLLPLCDQLCAIINSLERLMEKMTRWKEAVMSLKELLMAQGKSTQIIFQTWTIERFVQASQRLLQLYQKEMILKKNILENICHSKNKAELMFILACWAHEPYLEKTGMLSIDAMVTETGHVTIS
ncbi:cyclin-dependent kinase 2-interacting protein-like isoform X1 [Watersipora subatra]|uniref:cyclin-dependent kinase 2-interacting protein-like isoform X1 n=1 Tax=Watersipora subatra TaxID=2589382 RepID=UPI00355BDF85